MLRDSTAIANLQSNDLHFDEALSKLRDTWSRKIIFINVGDLIFCPRQICFRRLNTMPENKNQERFLVGRLLTIQFQELLLARYPRQFEIEKQIYYNCSNYYCDLGQGCIIYVLGKIDAFNKKTGPFEFKTIYSVEKIREPRQYHLSAT